MANNGQGVVDFGAGADLATLTITGIPDILSTSNVDAWLVLKDSVDHTLDEHLIEAIDVSAGNITVGVGFVVYARTRNTALRGKYNIGWAWL